MFPPDGTPWRDLSPGFRSAILATLAAFYGVALFVAAVFYGLV